MAAGNLRLAGFTTSERAAFRKQFEACRAVNRAVDTATAEERRVCRVHNRIRVELCDIAPQDFDFGHTTVFLSVLLTARADQFATIRSPAANNENDRAADLAGPAKIPLCLA